MTASAILAAWSAIRSRFRAVLTSRSRVLIRSGLADDLLLELLLDGAIVAVDPLIGGDDRLGQRDVGLGQRVEAIVDLVEGLEAEVLERLGDGKAWGSAASFLTRLAMCRARSQSRCRSPLILSTAATRRRSEATG